MLSKSGRKFLATYPLLGPRGSPKPLAYQERSVYYWWWQYLRRNKRYLKCCAGSGEGSLATLYADFGDVRSGDFRDWWETGNRGAYLFAELPEPDVVAEIKQPSEWVQDWNARSTMVVMVPLSWSKRAIKKAFARLLTKRLTRARGRAPLRGKASSSARYPLAQNFMIYSLKRDLAVYDARQAAMAQAKRTGQRRKTWYEIGCELRFVQSAMPSPDESKVGRDANKVNVMTVATSRAYKRASRRVALVAKGCFP